MDLKANYDKQSVYSQIKVLVSDSLVTDEESKRSCQAIRG